MQPCLYHIKLCQQKGTSIHPAPHIHTPTYPTPYIQKAKQLAETICHPRKLAEKVRKSQQQDFATKVR